MEQMLESIAHYPCWHKARLIEVAFTEDEYAELHRAAHGS
jgi:hypothetical protein